MAPAYAAASSSRWVVSPTKVSTMATSSTCYGVIALKRSSVL